MTEEEDAEREQLIEKFNCADITDAQLARLKELDAMLGIEWLTSV